MNYEDYIEYSISQQTNQNNFLKQINVINKKSGETYSLNYCVKKEYKKYYNWIVQNSIDIQNQALKMGFDGCFFITLTLDTQYHKKINNKHFNPKYNPKNTINKGYKLLNKTLRDITKQINRTIGKSEMLYIKVVEPHKDFTPHLHSIIYFKKENLQLIKQIIKNKINFVEYKNTNKGQKLQGSEGIGLVDLQEIENKERGASYLLKYLKKTFKDNTNINQIHFLNGWKKYNKIRILTYSQNKNNHINKYIWDKLLPHIPRFIKQSQNALTWAKDNTKITIYKNCKPQLKINNSTPYFDIKVYKTNKTIQVIKHKKEYKKFEKVLDNIKLINKFYYIKHTFWDVDIINKYIVLINKLNERNSVVSTNYKPLTKENNIKKFVKNIEYKSIKEDLMNELYDNYNKKIDQIEQIMLNTLDKVNFNFLLKIPYLPNRLKKMINDLEKYKLNKKIDFDKLKDRYSEILDYITYKNIFCVKLKTIYIIKNIVIFNSFYNSKVYDQNNFKVIF